MYGSWMIATCVVSKSYMVQYSLQCYSRHAKHRNRRGQDLMLTQCLPVGCGQKLCAKGPASSQQGDACKYAVPTSCHLSTWGFGVTSGSLHPGT